MASAAPLAAALQITSRSGVECCSGLGTVVGTDAALIGLQPYRAMAKRAVVVVTGDGWRGAAGGGVSDHLA